MKITEGNIQFYSGENLEQIAFPIGGMGSGMFCLEGTGTLTQFSLRNAPNIPFEPNIFAALTVKGQAHDKNISRVLEGPVPRHKIWNGTDSATSRGNGLGDKNYGLPRFRECRFHAKFPFAHIDLSDNAMPVTACITGWSPFIPSDADNSSLPCATLEYAITNTSGQPLKCVFYFASDNLMRIRTHGDPALEKATGPATVAPSPDGRGFMLTQNGSDEKPWDEGCLQITVDSEEDVFVDTAWFRGGWFDTMTMLWNGIESARCENKCAYGDIMGVASPGGLLAVPLVLDDRETRTVRVNLCWYVPKTNLQYGAQPETTGCGCSDCGCSLDNQLTQNPYYQPWYSKRFSSLAEVYGYYQANWAELRAKTLQFTETLFSSQVPAEILEAVTANLSILKSPTLLRQHDGRLWGWEGCCEGSGCCAGTCTHVWNYAQAVCHLFPQLERGLRVTEFFDNQDENGHQQFRSTLPVHPTTHDFHAAADGQLGGIMKVYRDWRISGDDAWLKRMWPKVRLSLEYCIALWDPRHEGVLRQVHHNTYDIEFYGPEPMCTSIYLGALRAAEIMAAAAGDASRAAMYGTLREKGNQYATQRLFNGEYYVQEMDFTGIDMQDTPQASFDRPLSAEARALIRDEGPKYQYGKGCLSDGVIGAWMASMFGLYDVLDAKSVKSHLRSIYKHNFRTDLHAHTNTQRPNYALGEDGGLLLCSWPDGTKRPSLPFVYSNEVWTGIEYQVASHMISAGLVDEGLQIVKTCRARYDGKVRNPFDEYECGHWYARALASYALLQAYTGARYDKVTKTLYVNPAVDGDTCALLCFDCGYGLAGVKDGKPFFQVVAGELEVREIKR